MSRKHSSASDEAEFFKREMCVFFLRSATNKHTQAQNHQANHTPVTLKLYAIPVFRFIIPVVFLCK